jgi:hypothetical protein
MRSNISKHYPAIITLVNTSVNFEGQQNDCLFTNGGGSGI